LVLGLRPKLRLVLRLILALTLKMGWSVGWWRRSLLPHTVDRYCTRLSGGRVLARGVLSCISESCESSDGLAGLLLLLAVGGLIWERAGSVARNIVELTPGRASWGRGIVDSLQQRLMYEFQELWRYLASIRSVQPLKEIANLLSGNVVDISHVPLANGLNDPSGSRCLIDISALLLDKDDRVGRLQILGPISRAWGIWVLASWNGDSKGWVDPVRLDQVGVQIIWTI
jgi:hypothetical protein